MQVTLYPTRIEIFDSGFILVMNGVDMRGAKRDENPVRDPSSGKPLRRVLIELAYLSEPYAIDLSSVENQARWTNDEAGVAACLADLTPIIGSSYSTSSLTSVKGSLEYNLGVLQLVGDEDSPGPDKAYITDPSGNKIWGALPAAGIADVANAGSNPDIQLIETSLPTGAGGTAEFKRIKRDGLGIRAQANTGNVQINIHFSAVDKIHYSDSFGDPLETALTTLARALLAGVNQASMQGTLGLVPGTDVASLVGGVVPTSQIPAVAITEFLGDIGSEAAMLALTGERGDWCIRTDNNRTYFLIDDDASVLANWRYIESPSAAITSVNGQTGVVVLAYSDVGAQQANAVLTTLTGATTDGQALITAANYAAMRTLLGLDSAPTSTGRSITQASHGFAVGDLIYYNGSAYAKAQANTAGTAECYGIVSAVAGVDDFTVITHGYVTGLSGLTAGTTYFLSDGTAGLLTATAPTTSGYIRKPQLIALSATTGHYNNFTGFTIA